MTATRAQTDDAVAVSWTTTEVRQYKAAFTPAELRAAGLTVRDGQLQQTEPPQSHWQSPDRFLASHEEPNRQKAGYIESRTSEVAGGQANPRL